MKRPAFPKDGSRIAWTPPRVAYIRHLAEVRRMTGDEVAEDIGLTKDQRARIYLIARRFKINLNGRSSAKGETLSLKIAVAGKGVPTLAALAKKFGRSKREIATLLVDGVLDQGQTFAENILDIEG